MSSTFRDNLSRWAGDVERTSRIAKEAHFLTAARWGKWNLWLGLLAVLVGVVGGTSAGLVISNLAAASVVSTAAGLLAAANSFLKPGGHEEIHKRAGDSWANVADRAANLWGLRLVHKDITEEKLQKEYDDLLSLKEQVTRSSPVLPTWAYVEASKHIKAQDAEERKSQ